jgi:hypothetical protein
MLAPGQRRSAGSAFNPQIDHLMTQLCHARAPTRPTPLHGSDFRIGAGVGCRGATVAVTAVALRLAVGNMPECSTPAGANNRTRATAPARVDSVAFLSLLASSAITELDGACHAFVRAI